jgi:hypothetical protein
MQASTLRRVIDHRHFDLCYSSGLLGIGIELRSVPCARGRRYAGRSKMSPARLVRHGLQMLLPFAPRVATRGRRLAGALTLVCLTARVAIRLSPRATLLRGALSVLAATSLLMAVGVSVLCLWLTRRAGAHV